MIPEHAQLKRAHGENESTPRVSARPSLQSHALSGYALLALQRSAGNQAVQRMLASATLQRQEETGEESTPRAAASFEHHHEGGGGRGEPGKQGEHREHHYGSGGDLYGGFTGTGAAPAQIVAALTAGRMPTEAEWKAATGVKVGDRGGTNREMLQLDTKLRAYALAVQAASAPGATTRPRMKILYEIERTIYAWSDRSTNRKSERRPAMLALLDCMQAEHKRLVQSAITAHEVITVADQDQLSAAEDVALQAVWQALVWNRAAGTNLDIVENRDLSKPWEPAGTTVEPNPGFELEVLTMFVRLFGTRAGRHLVDRLNANPTATPNERITIRPQEHSKPQPSPNTGVKQFGGEQPVGPARGAGVGSFVTFPGGLKDSTMVAKTKREKDLLSPAWIVFGHELIHAMHNKRGRNRNMQAMSAEEKAAWKNLEEKHTIHLGHTSEKTLRTQAGLAQERYGHGEAAA